MTVPSLELVNIPGGEITLRDDRTRRTWTVTLDDFMLATCPITQALYEEVTDERPSIFRAPAHPVESVTWWDAVRFCNALSEHHDLDPCYAFTGAQVHWDTSADGFRLPTDAEWEHACRGPGREVRYGALSEIAWFRENSGGQPRPVGEKLPNGWGVHDMLGNVWEWCWDRYDPEVYGEYRIFRGGGWADPERGCLASNRRRSHPSYAIDDLGFRVARSI